MAAVGVDVEAVVAHMICLVVAYATFCALHDG